MSNTLSNPTGHMRRALRLAEKGHGWVLPNPMVGAILVKDGERIAEGFHEKYGSDHAETAALKKLNMGAEGATLYVTLEPCSHHGKTPPCVDAIIRAGIKKVVIAVKDPSEKVNGKGITLLKEAGIEVELGLLEKEARELNKFFFTFHEKKRPFITAKVALSLDGKITEVRDKRTFLTGKQSEKIAHSLRHEHEAILVGGGTVLADDPKLNVRQIEGRDPLRIILKGNRELPKDASVFRDDNFLLFENKKVEEVLHELYEKGITSVLVEGGKEVLESFFAVKAIDEFHLFYAPLFLGENSLSLAFPENDLSFSQISVRKLGRDVYLRLKAEWDSGKA